MFKKISITCDEATTICDKNQYNEATLLDKVKLGIHFLTCKICRMYTKQNATMSGLFKIKAIDCKDKINCMSTEEKEALKKQLEALKK